MDQRDNGFQIPTFEQREQWGSELEDAAVVSNQEQDIKPLIPYVDVSNVVSLKARRDLQSTDGALAHNNFTAESRKAVAGEDNLRILPQISEADNLDDEDRELDARLVRAGKISIGLATLAIMASTAGSVIGKNNDTNRDSISPIYEAGQPQMDFNPKNPRLMR